MVKMTQNIFVGSILKIKTVIQTVDYLGTEPCGGLGGIITVLLEGGNTEDVTTGWPENWTRAIGGAWNARSPHHSHSRSHFQGHNLERVMCC